MERIEKNTINCDVCQSAYIEIDRPINDNDYYVCTMCRDYYEYNHETKLKDNTIDNDKTIDAGND